MPKIVDHELRRSQIAERSLNLFAEHGYATLSMRRLASSIGVTTGMLYHYFPSKQSLLSEAFRQVRARDIRIVQRLIRNQQGYERSNPELAVRLLASFVVDNGARLAGLLQIGMDVRRVEPKNPIVIETIEDYRRALQDIFAVDDGNAHAALWILFGCITETVLGGEVDSGLVFMALSRILLPNQVVA